MWEVVHFLENDLAIFITKRGFPFLYNSRTLPLSRFRNKYNFRYNKNLGMLSNSRQSFIILSLSNINDQLLFLGMFIKSVSRFDTLRIGLENILFLEF